MPTLNWIERKAVENHHSHAPFSSVALVDDGAGEDE